jgi:geranylgeranyl reductase family protein
MYDVIIVGGGPAGSSAGRRAGINGLHTLLIEKEVFPRYKACGGALSERALSYLDFPLPSSLREREIFGARFRFKGSVIEGSHESRIATMITRSILDDYLLEKGRETGIEIKVGEKVIDYKEQGDFVEIVTNKNVYRSKFVIIGEGSQGKLKRKVRVIDTKGTYGVCIVADVGEDIEKIDQAMFNIVEIHFDVLNMGYGWIFPHKNYYSVGIGAFANKIMNPKGIMNEFLKKNGFNGTYRFRGHTIPAGGIKRNVVSSRTVLVGDAAGFVDPFAGEGLAYAIRSGQIAADIITETIRGNNNGAHLKQQYESMCQREFADDFKYALLTVKMMHRFPDFFFKILTGKQEVFEKFIQIPDLTRHYRSYLEWLIPRLPKYLLSTFVFQ